LNCTRERRAASRESRRARQLPATKPPKLTADRQEQLRRRAATGEPVRELAAAFGIGRATAYRYLAQVSHRFPVTEAGPGRFPEYVSGRAGGSTGLGV
jgi:DNA invertase Pin-like site-specific DNA recombinase